METRILGLHQGYIGIVKNKIETPLPLRLRVCLGALPLLVGNGFVGIP